jgi:hypothetical protein
VSYQSGQIHKVYLRRHCNKFLRHTSNNVVAAKAMPAPSAPWANVG